MHYTDTRKKVCLYCFREFEALRTDAKFCCTQHRVYWHKMRKHYVPVEEKPIGPIERYNRIIADIKELSLIDKDLFKNLEKELKQLKQAKR